MNAFVQNMDSFYPLEAVLSIIGVPEKLARNKLNILKIQNLQNKICAFRKFFVEISKKMINNICITFQDF